MEIIKRFEIGFWSNFRKSAAISRADRKAVSPEVRGAAITPSKANTPPTGPSHVLEIWSTI